MLKTAPGIRPCTIVYLLLMLLTLITWAVGVAGLDGLIMALMVLGLALLKAQLIGDYYMGLKRVSGVWRWVIIGWLFFTGSLISIAFWITAG